MAVDAVTNNVITSGTANGLLEYFDYLTNRGYGRTSTVDPWRSATRQILQTTEGTEDYGEVDIRGMDVDAYLSRYETLARGGLRAESIETYGRRFRRAVETYREFLNTGRPPAFRPPRMRRERPVVATPSPTPDPTNPPAHTPAAVSGGGLIDYPFPLKSGQVAYVRLPMRVERSDIERMTLFLRSLVLEPQRELSAPEESGDESEVR